MRKTLVFDMDGTIADLYGVNGWLENLREENARPYIEAKPLYDMDVLASILGLLRLRGWTIAITSWLSKESTKAYDKKVREAKKKWLAKYNFHHEEIQIKFNGAQIVVQRTIKKLQKMQTPPPQTHNPKEK